MIKREIQGRIASRLFAGKVIIIYGARQVGKTTLIRSISRALDQEERSSAWSTGDLSACSVNTPKYCVALKWPSR